jgi:hypothetical protein
MQPERGHKACALRGALLAVLVLAGGCATLARFGPSHPAGGAAAPTVDRDTQVAAVLADTIQTMQRLAAGSPAEQAEIVNSARQAYERAPGGGAQLRYALMLATPGHASRDASQARQLLRALSAQPEALAPVERAVALLELAQLDRELGLVGDNERLQAIVLNNADQEEHLAAANRRLQSTLEENTRLRHQVEELQAKLDAVVNIERNLTERKPNTEGRKK